MVTIPHNIRVGPAGWQYTDWDGTVYPSPRPRGFDPLVFVASYFNVVEINSTFYRTPAVTSARRWVERVAHRPGFRFSLKALNQFTHGDATANPAEIDAFKRAVGPIHEAGRLSAVLLQFPWSFRDTTSSRRRIDALARAFAPMPVAVEVRHGSWARENAWHHLSATGLSVCGIDQPVIGDSLRPGRFLVGAAGLYVRLHGRNYRDWFGTSGRDARYDYHYTREELAPWVDAMVRAASAGTAVTAILNNHFRGQAPANAFDVMAMIAGDRVPAPRSIVRAWPDLADVTDVSGDPDVADGWLFDPPARTLQLPAEDDENEEKDDTDDESNLDVPR